MSKPARQGYVAAGILSGNEFSLRKRAASDEGGCEAPILLMQDDEPRVSSGVS